MPKMKKIVSALLAIMLTLNLGIANPAFAEDLDPTNVVESSTLLSIEQNGQPLAQNINIGSPIQIRTEIQLKLVNVLPSGNAEYLAKKGDILTISFDQNLRLARIPAPTPIEENGTQVGMLSYENLPTGAVAKIEFTVDNENLPTTEQIHKATVNVTTSLELMDGIADGETVNIFGNVYTVKKILQKKYQIKKSGDYNPQTGIINWLVIVSAEDENGLPATLEGLHLRDIQDQASFGGIVGDFLVAGDIKNPAVNGNVIEYTFEANHTGRVMVEYSTKLKDEFFFNQVETGSLVHDVQNTYEPRVVNNTASLMNESKTREIVSSEVQKEITTNHISKFAYSNFDKLENRQDFNKVSWEITFNQQSLDLKNVRIEDWLPQGLTFEKAKRYEEQNPGTDNWVEIGDIVPNQYGTYTIGDINKPNRIVIVSAAPSQGGLSKIAYYVNESYIKTDSYKTEVKSTKVGKTGINVIYKGATLQGQNALKWENDGLYAHWQIEYVYSGVKLPDDLKVYDIVYYKHQPMTSQSKKIIDFTTVDQVNLPDVVKLNLAKVSQEDYQATGQEFVEDSIVFENGALNHRFIPIMKDGIEVGKILEVSGFAGDKTQRIKYKTRVIEPSLLMPNTHGPRGFEKSISNEVFNAAFLADGNGNLVNHASSTHHSKGGQIYKETVRAEDVQRLQNPSLYLNLFEQSKAEGKISGINNKTNEVVYRISVNAKGESLSKTKFYDEKTNSVKEFGKISVLEELPKGWEIVPFEDGDLIKLFEGVKNELSLRTNVVNPAPLNLEDEVELDYVNDYNNPTLNIKFKKDMVKPYALLVKMKPSSNILTEYFTKKPMERVEYKVAEKGEVTEVTNKVTIKTENWDTGVIQIASVQVKNDLLNKKSEYIGGGAIKWTVDYKPMGANYQIAGQNPALVDTIPEGIRIPLDADGNVILGKGYFQAFEINTAINGSENIGKEVQGIKDFVSFNVDTKELKIEIPDKNKNYRFAYVTDTVSPGSVSNSIRVLSDNNAPKTPVIANFNVEEVHVSASLDRLGLVKVLKVDKETRNPLVDAAFQLQTQSGKKLREVKSNDKGEVVFGHLYQGIYKIKETKAPDNYKENAKEYHVEIKKDAVTNRFVAVMDGKKLQDNQFTVENEKMPDPNQPPVVPPPVNPPGGGNGNSGNNNPPPSPQNPPKDNKTGDSPSIDIQSPVRPDKADPKKNEEKEDKKDEKIEKSELNSPYVKDPTPISPIQKEKDSKALIRKINEDELGDEKTPHSGIDKENLNAKAEQESKIPKLKSVPKTGIGHQKDSFWKIVLNFILKILSFI